jgi:RimJ/RimL family protein N-acetyltransferase
MTEVETVIRRLTHLRLWPSHCHGLGIRRIFIDVNEQNEPSLRVIRQIGFKDIGTFYILRLGKRRYTYIPRSLYRHVRF